MLVLKKASEFTANTYQLNFLGSSQKNPLVLYQLKESRTKENQYDKKKMEMRKNGLLRILLDLLRATSLVPKDGNL
jgi:hypothetical protein